VLGKENFVKKIEAQVVFKKNRKTFFADGLCQGLSAQVFSKKKIENPSLPTACDRGSRHRCLKKIEKPYLPTASARGSRHRLFSKK
jgi:hypothetical protein